MNTPQQFINLNDLCSLLFNLVCQSCQILKSFDDFEHLVWKDQNNPVTQVDYLIQAYLVSSLKRTFPHQPLRIIGEEDLTYSDIPEFESIVNDRLEGLRRSQLESSHQLPKELSCEKELKAEDIAVWIDPLDCTAGFTNNRHYEVTILVGIAYQGKPICGIIGHPFKKRQNKCVYQPTVLMGSSSLTSECAFEYNIDSKEWSQIYRPIQSERNKVAVSWRNPCKLQTKIIKHLGLEPQRCGGAGYKCLRVIKGEVDSVFLMNLKTSKWDTCAGEAIILGMGGCCTSPYLQQIDYQDDKNTTNPNGFLMTTNKTIFDKFTKTVEDWMKKGQYST